MFSDVLDNLGDFLRGLRVITLITIRIIVMFQQKIMSDKFYNLLLLETVTVAG